MDVFEPVYVQSFVHRVFMPESTLRSPMQETDLSGKKDRAHGNKKKKKKVHPQYRHPRADSDRRLSQAASFIKVEHKTGHSLTP